MSDYYINSFNDKPWIEPEDLFPYDTPDKGAINFYELLEGLHNIFELLNNGDIIHIAAGDYIDDSLNTIKIYHSITIKMDDGLDIPIHLPISSDGFIVYSDGVKFDGIQFYKTQYQNNSMVTIKSNDVIIDNCNFDYGVSTGIGSLINLNNVYNFTLSNTHLSIPLGDDLSYGIYGTNSSYCTIYNNVIDMDADNGHAITFLGSSNHNNISYNIIGNFSSSDDNNIAIEFNNDGNYNKIMNNAIGISGPNSAGIIYATNDNSGIGVVISNNLLVMRENDESSIGIHIPYSQNNMVSTFDIINNIIDYRGDSESIYFGSNTYNEDENNSIAINASIVRGMIDFNNIYGFSIINRFVSNGAPGVISELGDKNIFVDPRLVWFEDDKYPVNDIRRYYCYSNSECIGSGYLNHNIGIGVDDINITDNHYINIIDTVTNDIGYIKSLNYNPTYTFFNNLFTENADRFNDMYRPNNNTSTAAYASEEVYKNQWDYIYDISFPFEHGDHFYKKDFTYVFQHKGDLKPFDGIKCPANPGYGYTGYGYPLNGYIQGDTPYPGYENGLWGYPRISYRNNCHPDPCIIQDSYTETIRWEDQIDNVRFWIQDTINPECLDSI